MIVVADLTNRLAAAASPYLRQHAANPVHWQPWDDAALASAADLDRPILLSVGYAACHWCHVMARESFEDDDTANLMNSLFVCIKVDREERPDLDRLFLGALAGLGIAAGWPLTAFLTPAGEPFAGGGYYPISPKFGLPAFRSVLQDAEATYRRDGGLAARAGRAAMAAVAAPRYSAATGAISTVLADRVAHELARSVDWLYGGFGIQAPKFLYAGGHEMLLRSWMRTGEPGLLDAAVGSMKHICDSGVYDHVGGGFHRYAADDRWRVPHFEKMLCDNAIMVRLLVKLWQASRWSQFADRAAGTLDWMLREMRLPGGVFASSLAADGAADIGTPSEGVAYTWLPHELDAILGVDAAGFRASYELAGDGPFDGRCVIVKTPGAPETATGRVYLERLRQRRDARRRPDRDEKVLADWNGLAISALAEAGLAFDRPDWLEAAATAFTGIVDLLSVGSSLRHSWFDGEPGPHGFLDDYANMAAAALSLHEATDDPRFVHDGRAWMEVLDGRFWDPAGGYFLTETMTGAATIRQVLIDETTAPAGNATLLAVLPRLAILSGDDAYRSQAAAIERRFADRVSRARIAAATALNNCAAADHLIQIVIVGDCAEVGAMRSEAAGRFIPDRLLVIANALDSVSPTHPAFGKVPQDGVATGYVCIGPMCLEPATTLETFRSRLEQACAPLDGVAGSYQPSLREMSSSIRSVDA